MSVTKRMRILKTVEIGEIGEKDAKRIHILKTVELADFAEKIPKEWEFWKWESSNVVLRWANWSHCNALYFCYANPKRKEFTIFHSIFECFANFFIHETRLFAISRKSTSFRSRRFPRPRKSTVFRRAQKNTSKISRQSTENRMTKRTGFYKKWSEVCEVYRFR